MTCHVFVHFLDFPAVIGDEGSVEKKVTDHILPVVGMQLGTGHTKTSNMLTGCNKLNANLADHFHSPLPKRDIEGNDERLIVRPLYVDLIQGLITQKQVIRSYQMCHQSSLEDRQADETYLFAGSEPGYLPSYGMGGGAPEGHGTTPDSS
jgi:hypothetical protein